MEKTVAAIRGRLQDVLERMERATLRVGRDPDTLRLVVVTKTHPIEVVRAAVEAGARFLGENYADEAMPKIFALGDSSPVEWHMIGHVQSRKAKLVCEYFQYMHSLDSLKLAQKLNRLCGDRQQTLPALLECNLAGEETKSGWAIWDENDWENLLPEFEMILGLSNLRIDGLMGMPPFMPDPEQSRPYYQRLRRFQEFLKRQLPQAEWRELSMGMSGDFEVAVEEGATWVRIGTSILGPRPS